MADPVSPPAPPAPATDPAVTTPAPEAPPPLDQATLGDYMSRRAKPTEGTPAPPASAPAPTAPDAAAPDDEAELPPVNDLTPKALRRELATRAKVHATQLRNKEQHIQVLEEKLAALSKSAAPAPPAPTAPAEPEGPPVLETYLAQGQTYDDWLDARIQWGADQRLASERATQTRQAAEQQLRQDVAGYPARVQAAQQKYPDYDAVLQAADDIPTSPVLSDVLVRHAQGADMMYWLASHPDEARSLAQMTAHYGPPARPLVELLLLEKMRAGQAVNGASPAAVSLTRAPAPITPVGGGATSSTTPLDEAPVGEFIRRRNAELEKRRGRA